MAAAARKHQDAAWAVCTRRVHERHRCAHPRTGPSRQPPSRTFGLCPRAPKGLRHRVLKGAAMPRRPRTHQDGRCPCRVSDHRTLCFVSTAIVFRLHQKGATGDLLNGAARGFPARTHRWEGPMAPDGVRRRCWVAAVCEKQGRGSESRIRVLHSLAAKHTTSMNSSRKPRSNGSQHSRNMQSWVGPLWGRVWATTLVLRPF